MVKAQFEGLVFGVPKEIMPGENRVAVIPATVRKIVDAGGKVLVESSAGKGAHTEDDEYIAAGASIMKDPEQVFSQADIILKVKEPQHNPVKKEHEIEMMHPGQVLVTFLHPAAPANRAMIKALADRKVTSLTLDSIPRISRAQAMDALTSMSTVAGYKSVISAANRLPKFVPMIGSAVGMNPPSNVLVVGTGVAGLQAVATAKRLGAQVYAADIRKEASEHAKSVGARIVDTGVPEEAAVGEGGYAKPLEPKWLSVEHEALGDTIALSDIVILTALVPGRQAPILVTEGMVKRMKPGSIIVDVAIDQGGNSELTVGGEVVTKYGVIIDGTKNIPGMLPISSTSMFANNIYNFVASFVREGEVRLDTNDEIIASTLVTKDGQILHIGALESLATPDSEVGV